MTVISADGHRLLCFFCYPADSQMKWDTIRHPLSGFVAFLEYPSLPLACPPDAFRPLMTFMYPFSSHNREHLGLQVERAHFTVMLGLKGCKHRNQVVGAWAWYTTTWTALEVQTLLVKVPMHLSSACLSVG